MCSKKLSSSISLLLTLLLICRSRGHVLNEEDYWDREQRAQDVLQHMNTNIVFQMKYMLLPGASCNPKLHFDSMLLHHAVRHGLLELPEPHFIRVLNKMCRLIPDVEVHKFYQTLRCVEQRCDCPYTFLTWSAEESKCKVREGYFCGQMRIMNVSLELDSVFGCETGTECTARDDMKVAIEAASSSSSESEDSSPASAVRAVSICRCMQSNDCGRAREKPPPTDVRPPNLGTTPSLDHLGPIISSFYVILKCVS